MAEKNDRSPKTTVNFYRNEENNVKSIVIAFGLLFGGISK